MTQNQDVEIAVIGAGIAGIAVAYYLCTEYDKRSVLLIDSRQPMSFTSAQSGDNYRNWWPHPTMVNFTNHGIDLMERIARESSNVLQMTRRGYAIATRQNHIDELIAELHAGYNNTEADPIHIHTGSEPSSYCAPINSDWTKAPAGVDVLSNQSLIRRTFPSFSEEIANVVHIRRAGGISGQQLGQHMLERIKASGGQRKRAHVKSIAQNGKFALEVEGANGIEQICADVIVNAAGPFAAELAAMIGVELPIENIFQQKIAFEDEYGAIPRSLPFSIDSDEQELNWTDEERDLLTGDPDMAWLARAMPGGIHCRPDGGDTGTWVKLGWAYNHEISEPQQDLANEQRFDPQFPEIVLRGAAALNPSLHQYVESFPRHWTHYGGYYPMTRENWPLIGPLGSNGAFIAGALSGFGSMSACAAGSLCAAWIATGDLPAYATQLSLARYDDQELMTGIENTGNRGIL